MSDRGEATCETCALGVLAGVRSGRFCPMVTREYRPGDMIYRKGALASYVWYVREGQVALCCGEERGAGAMVGTEALSEGHYAHTATATTKTLLCGATREGFIQMLESEKGGGG